MLGFLSWLSLSFSSSFSVQSLGFGFLELAWNNMQAPVKMTVNFCGPHVKLACLFGRRLWIEIS